MMMVSSNTPMKKKAGRGWGDSDERGSGPNTCLAYVRSTIV